MTGFLTAIISSNEVIVLVWLCFKFFLISFISLWLNFLVTRYSGDSVLEEQFERFKKAMAAKDDETAEQVMKEMG